jgi:hypothetical protein
MVKANEGRRQAHERSLWFMTRATTDSKRSAVAREKYKKPATECRRRRQPQVDHEKFPENEEYHEPANEWWWRRRPLAAWAENVRLGWDGAGHASAGRGG